MWCPSGLCLLPRAPVLAAPVLADPVLADPVLAGQLEVALDSLKCPVLAGHLEHRRSPALVVGAVATEVAAHRRSPAVGLGAVATEAGTM